MSCARGGAEQYTYTGKEKDSASELFYYEARFYDPRIAHFSQADEISPDAYDPQQLNRYSYARGNPIKFSDPTGHLVFDTSKAVFGNGVDWATGALGNTAWGSKLGDVMLAAIVGPSADNASNDVRAATYAEAAAGIDHAYSVTKAATGKSLGAAFSLFTGGPQDAISDMYELTTMLAVESGTVSSETAEKLGLLGDFFELYGISKDLQSLRKGHLMNREGYKNLMGSIGRDNYQALRGFAKAHHLRDLYTIFKSADKLDDIGRVKSNQGRH